MISWSIHSSVSAATGAFAAHYVGEYCRMNSIEGAIFAFATHSLSLDPTVERSGWEKKGAYLWNLIAVPLIGQWLLTRLNPWNQSHIATSFLFYIGTYAISTTTNKLLDYSIYTFAGVATLATVAFTFFRAVGPHHRRTAAHSEQRGG